MPLRTLKLAAALGALLLSCGQPPSAPGRGTAVLFVALPLAGSLEAKAATPGPVDGAPANGSAERPFPSLSAALRAAPPGALLQISAGVSDEALLITRPVVLLGRGPALTRLVRKPGAEGASVVIRGTDGVELRGLAIEGGAVGISVRGGKGHRFEDLALRGLGKTGLSSEGAGFLLAGSEILDVDGGATGQGLLIEGGAAELRTLLFRAAGRRAIEIKKARAVLTDVDVDGSSLSALQAVDGAEVTVRGSRFEHLGGAALYAGGARLTVENSFVRAAEYAIIGFRGATVTVTGCELRDQHVAAVSLVRSAGTVAQTQIVHGGTEGAVTVTSGSAPLVLTDNQIVDPGPMGVHVTQSTLHARGNSITGARLDGGKDLGDAIYALDSDLLLEGNVLRGNAGSGVELTRCSARLERNDLVENGRAGFLLQDRSRATATGNFFQRNRGAGVELAEGSHLSLTRNRFGVNGAFDLDAGCGQSSAAELGAGNTFTGAVRQRACP